MTDQKLDAGAGTQTGAQTGTSGGGQSGGTQTQTGAGGGTNAQGTAGTGNGQPGGSGQSGASTQGTAKDGQNIGGGTLLDGTKTGDQTGAQKDGAGNTGSGAADGKTGMGDAKTGDAKTGDQTQTTDFPADWRQKLAGEDKKVLAKLERFGSPQDLLKSYNELQAKLDRGDFKKPLPENPTPEQMAEWRKDNGIPEKATDYKIDLKDGLVIGDYEKPIVDKFLAEAHAQNLTQQQVNSQLNWYFNSLEQQTQQRFEKDSQLKEQTTEELIKEWGPEYRGNLNLIRGLLDTMPESVRENFAFARLANGESLLNTPDMARWLNQIARTVNPVHSVVPGAKDQGLAIDTELNDLQKKMGDRNSDYWKGPMADRNQSRYRELVSAKERLNKR